MRLRTVTVTLEPMRAFTAVVEREWDEQMKRDIAAGRFDAVIREIDEDIHAGRLRDMP